MTAQPQLFNAVSLTAQIEQQLHSMSTCHLEWPALQRYYTSPGNGSLGITGHLSLPLHLSISKKELHGKCTYVAYVCHQSQRRPAYSGPTYTLFLNGENKDGVSCFVEY